MFPFSYDTASDESEALTAAPTAPNTWPAAPPWST